MYFLGIETTGPVGSVALLDVDGESGFVLKKTAEPMGHLRNLMGMIDEMLAEQNAGPEEIEAVAVSVGPGSYTGIRIGVATARAICQALDVPAIPVISLYPYKGVAIKSREPGTVAAIFNARRGQVYGAVYGPEGEEILAPGPCMLTDVMEAVKDRPNAVFYGDGVDAYAEELAGYRAADEEERYPTADWTIRGAMDLLLKAEAQGEDPRVRYDEISPVYMRKTEAEQKLADGTLERQRKEKMERLRNG